MEHKKRLYRSTQHKVLGGVAGGLGEYFDLDPVILRVLFVLLLFASGVGFLAYIILWIAVPQREAKNAINENLQASVEEIVPEEIPGSKQRNNLVIGIMLIALGLLFFMHLIIPRFDMDTLWPLAFIILGGILIYGAYNKQKKTDKMDNDSGDFYKSHTDTRELPKHDDSNISSYKEPTDF